MVYGHRWERRPIILCVPCGAGVVGGIAVPDNEWERITACMNGAPVPAGVPHENITVEPGHCYMWGDSPAVLERANLEGLGCLLAKGLGCYVAPVVLLTAACCGLWKYL
jgi:hypothetical protein